MTVPTTGISYVDLACTVLGQLIELPSASLCLHSFPLFRTDFLTSGAEIGLCQRCIGPLQTSLPWFLEIGECCWLGWSHLCEFCAQYSVRCGAIRKALGLSELEGNSWVEAWLLAYKGLFRRICTVCSGRGNGSIYILINRERLLVSSDELIYPVLLRNILLHPHH